MPTLASVSQYAKTIRSMQCATVRSGASLRPVAIAHKQEEALC